jgi:hypothetical protein
LEENKNKLKGEFPHLISELIEKNSKLKDMKEKLENNEMRVKHYLNEINETHQQLELEM